MGYAQTPNISRMEDCGFKAWCQQKLFKLNIHQIILLCIYFQDGQEEKRMLMAVLGSVRAEDVKNVDCLLLCLC